MLRIKMNKFLESLGVEFVEEREEFVITTPETDNVKSVVDYNDFPNVKYDYNRFECCIEITELNYLDAILAEIIEFVEAEKEKIREASKKVAKKLEELSDE